MNNPNLKETMYKILSELFTASKYDDYFELLDKLEKAITYERQLDADMKEIGNAYKNDDENKT